MDKDAIIPNGTLFNKTLLLFLSLVFMAITVAVLPLCSPYELMLAILLANACFIGGLDTAWAHENLLNITGKVTSLILVAASVGTVINPIIIGYLMEELTPMWYCYLLVFGY
ncbi:uncharacterized protein LOC126824821 [Patella vulgata]|uniref:uncharacterized protein LOC126824821 n=1 Tax=Patella vulgata TaxID=6465 RepID=UPI0024A89191|nr:uncharacterized protein LOC126824821 [Patella vulgata]